MRPSRLTLAIGVVYFVAAILSLFLPEFAGLWWVPGGVLSLFCIADAIRSALGQTPAFRREIAPLMTAGVPAIVSLVATRMPAVRRLRIFDGIPDGFTAPSLPVLLTPISLQATGGVVISYECRTERRGDYRFVPAWVEFPSPMGFWVRRSRACTEDRVKVYPNFGRFSGQNLYMTGDIGPSVKARQTQRRGLGLEFHQLREYRQGDMMRMVDYKASSRFGKLIVKEMQEEEDQTVIFLLDTGFRMTASEGESSHFDRAFEAMLSLTYVALKQGDRVGVRTWGPDERWIPPSRGVSTLSAIAHRLYDIQAAPAASDPALALGDIIPTLRRRCLLILLTNFREGDGAGIDALLPIIARRHLLCTVWMRESVSQKLSERIPKTHDEAIETVMARFYITERERCRREWEARGVFTIDTTPEALSARLVQRYWDIKKRGLL